MRHFAPCLTLVLLGTIPAIADQPPGTKPGPDAAWWQGAHSPAGALCCGVADGRMVTARLLGAVWQVYIDGQWDNVPGEAVLYNYPTHPAGSAAVWMRGTTIVCFSPPRAGG